MTLSEKQFQQLKDTLEEFGHALSHEVQHDPQQCAYWADFTSVVCNAILANLCNLPLSLLRQLAGLKPMQGSLVSPVLLASNRLQVLIDMIEEFDHQGNHVSSWHKLQEVASQILQCLPVTQPQRLPMGLLFSLSLGIDSLQTVHQAKAADKQA